MNDTFATFWMVWSPNGRAPTYQHSSADSAEREVERLARANPGQAFFVLMATKCAEVKAPPVVWSEADDDGPF